MYDAFNHTFTIPNNLNTGDIEATYGDGIFISVILKEEETKSKENNVNEKKPYHSRYAYDKQTSQ
jgi:HSP20 family molecular chaperone IbpA